MVTLVVMMMTTLAMITMRRIMMITKGSGTALTVRRQARCFCLSPTLCTIIVIINITITIIIVIIVVPHPAILITLIINILIIILTPTTTQFETKSASSDLIRSSIGYGAMFFPPLVMITSLIRPRIVTNPSSMVAWWTMLTTMSWK